MIEKLEVPQLGEEIEISGMKGTTMSSEEALLMDIVAKLNEVIEEVTEHLNNK